MQKRELLKVGEVAPLLGLSVPAVYRWLVAGELPSVRVGRSWRIPADALERYLSDRTTEAPAYKR